MRYNLSKTAGKAAPYNETPDWVAPAIGAGVGGIGGLAFNRYVLDNKTPRSALLAGLLGAGLGAGTVGIINVAGNSSRMRKDKANAADSRKIQKILMAHGIEPTDENIETFMSMNSSGPLGIGTLTLATAGGNIAANKLASRQIKGLRRDKLTTIDLYDDAAEEIRELDKQYATGKISEQTLNKKREKIMKRVEAGKQRIFEERNPWLKGTKLGAVLDKVDTSVAGKLPKSLSNVKVTKPLRAVGNGIRQAAGGPLRAAALALALGADTIRATTKKSRTADALGITPAELDIMREDYNN